MVDHADFGVHRRGYTTDNGEPKPGPPRSGAVFSLIEFLEKSSGHVIRNARACVTDRESQAHAAFADRPDPPGDQHAAAEPSSRCHLDGISRKVE